MFAGVKYYRTCAGHSDVSVINTTQIVSETFDPLALNPSKLFNVKCEKSANQKSPAFILFVTSKYVFMFHIVQRKSLSFPRITCSLSSCTEGNT